MSEKTAHRLQKEAPRGIHPKATQGQVELAPTRPALKIWLETDKGYVIGEGTHDLLSRTEAFGSLSRASQSLGMSYRHAWGLIKKTEARIGGPVLETRRGGRNGGGGARLTDLGRSLLQEFHRSRDAFLGEAAEHPTQKATGWAQGTVTSVSRKRDRVEARISGHITLTLDPDSPIAGRLRKRNALTTQILAATVTEGKTERRRGRASK